MIAQTAEKYAKNRDLIRKAQLDEDSVSLVAMEELIGTNMGLVRSIALRFQDRGTDLEDLVQIGIVGMIKAVRSFDLSRETTFSTYAVPLIIGEIRRHLRDDGLIKISRGQRKLGLELMNARNQIVTFEGREPRIEELASLCGVTAEEAAVAIDAVAPVSSLSESIGSEDGALTLESRIADEENEMERLSDSIALEEALGKLPPLWKKIVLLRYYRNLTQQETAERLGLSQVKVSREEKKIMIFLRQELVG